MKFTKKIYFLFSLTVFILSLSVGVNATYADEISTSSEEGTTLSQEDVQTYADGKIDESTIESLVEQYVSAISAVSSYSSEELAYVAEVTDYQTDLYTNFADIVGEDSCGVYQSYDNLVVDEDVEDADSDAAVDASVDLHFENKDITMTLHINCFDTVGSIVTSTEFSLTDEGEESFGEKMTTALSNTLMGMGVVFAILIFIYLIISCFKYIPAAMDRLAGRKTKTESDLNIEESVVEKAPAQQEKKDDTELIAVIAAAIAASENTSTDSFVVRSIRRR